MSLWNKESLFPPSTSFFPIITSSSIHCTVLAKSASGSSSLTRLLDLLARLRLSCSLTHLAGDTSLTREDGSKIHCLGVVLLEQKMATTEMVRDGLCCGCRRQSRTRIQRTRKAGGLTFFHTCVQCEAQRKTLVGVLFTHWKVEMDVEKCLPLSVAEGVRKEEWKETSRHTLLPGCFPFIFHLPLH